MERQSEKIENDLDKFEFGINKCKLEDFLSYGTINELSHFLAKQGYTKQEWISVDKRLPVIQGKYLVYTYDRRMFMCDLIDHYCDGNLQFDDYRVTHWMPLPQPPKMKGAE